MAYAFTIDEEDYPDHLRRYRVLLTDVFDLAEPLDERSSVWGGAIKITYPDEPPAPQLYTFEALTPEAEQWLRAHTLRIAVVIAR